MRLEDVAVGEVQPGEQDQLVADLNPMKSVAEGRVDVEHGAGCALERLVGGVVRRA
jgi:hypothetical protein